MLYEKADLLAPSTDEFEISIFGTGCGESILCYIGDNEWVVIDSCLNPKTKKSLILEYLDIIDPAANISLIIATHFHDDHIKGLSQIVSKYPKSLFVCSNALNGDDFLQLVVASEDVLIDSSSGCKEFHSILNSLKTAPKTASEAKKLYQNKNCEIYSLSPSDDAELLARQEIKSYLPQVGGSRKRVVLQNTNHYSVVIKCIFRGQAIWLLGSDLENTPNKRLGWEAILSSKVIDTKKSHVFKIPHHGSEGAHHDEVWSKLLVDNPVSLLTPFVKAGVVLPTKTALNRIKKYSKRAYITGKPEAKKSKNENPTVRKIIKEFGTELYDIDSQIGHIQLRMNCHALDRMDVWEVKTFGTAVDITGL